MAASKELESIYKAMAIVATSPALRLIAKFFIHFHKPPRPTQIFFFTRRSQNLAADIFGNEESGKWKSEIGLKEFEKKDSSPIAHYQFPIS